MAVVNFIFICAIILFVMLTFICLFFDFWIDFIDKKVEVKNYNDHKKLYYNNGNIE